MPPIRNRKPANEENEDDGTHSLRISSGMSPLTTLKDMPPLVDNPNPGMTYTFFTDLTPQSFPGFNSSQNTLPSTPLERASDSSVSVTQSPPPSPLTPEDQVMPSPVLAPRSTRGHGKKRDASYIPRPPNAFILFRSSFIRSQQIPEKVEGNHSNLSRIIGHYWRSLSPEERADWEAKAVIAQEEHRRMYPDWRFRPGPYAMARLKTKDGGPVRKRNAVGRTKDPPDGGNHGQDGEVIGGAQPLKVGSKGKGKGKERAKDQMMGSKDLAETRCEMIANLIVEGKTGTDLASAVEEWEGKKKRVRSKVKPSSSRLVMEAPPPSVSFHATKIPVSNTRESPGNHDPSVNPSSEPADSHRQLESSSSSTSSLDTRDRNISPSRNRVKPTQAPQGKHHLSSTITDDLSHVPLTHMFRRSLSTPSTSRTAEESSSALTHSATSTQWHGDRPVEEISSHAQHSNQTRRNTLPTDFSYDYGQSIWEAERGRQYHVPIDRQSCWWHSPQSDATESSRTKKDQESTPVEMGYEASGTVGDFERGYSEHYDALAEVPLDGSESVDWNANANRQGFLTIINDPYGAPEAEADSSDPIPPPKLTLPLPSFLESSSSPTLNVISPNTHLVHTPYYDSMSPLTPSNFPSSSFSTLTGWAGDDYKFNSATQGRSRTNTFDAIHSASWNSDVDWQGHHRIQPSIIAIDPPEWARLEESNTPGSRSASSR